MKKAALVTVVLVAILAAIAGCTLFQASTPLHVITIIKYTHPVSEVGGFPVALEITGGTGRYTVNWGDGTVNSQLTHLYTAPIKSTYTVTITSGNYVKEITVSVINHPPVINAPTVEQAWQWEYLAWLDRAVIDFTPHEQVVDCPRRTVYHYGVSDPDGDKVLLTIHVQTNGTENTIFTLQDELVSGPTPVGKYEWWPGWTGKEVPGYPIYIHSEGIQPQGLLSATITVTATDEWGATAQKEFQYVVKRYRCQGATK